MSSNITEKGWSKNILSLHCLLDISDNSYLLQHRTSISPCLHCLLDISDNPYLLQHRTSITPCLHCLFGRQCKQGVILVLCCRRYGLSDTPKRQCKQGVILVLCCRRYGLSDTPNRQCKQGLYLIYQISHTFYDKELV
jgi:hypothetical protein